MKDINNYKCFSKPMALYMEAHGCKLVDVYHSQISNRDVFEFDNSPETWAVARAYVEAYEEFKASKNV